MKNNTDPYDGNNLPTDPPHEDLMEEYLRARKLLVSANRSRSALKGHDSRRQKLILDLQSQLQDIENDLRDEAESRIRIHALNARIAEIVGDLETGLDETASIIGEPSSGGLTPWVIKLARLLPIVMRLRQIKRQALQLLGRNDEEKEPILPADVPVTAAPEEQDLKDFVSSSRSIGIEPKEESSVQAARGSLGPLLLKDLDYAYGLLLLYSPGQSIPEGFRTDATSDWLAGQALVVPQKPEDELYAPVEAGFRALDEPEISGDTLHPWLSTGVLPFAMDPEQRLLRLLPLEQLSDATHVLVQEKFASSLQNCGAESLPLDFDDDRWQGFEIQGEECHHALQHVVSQMGTILPAVVLQEPRISNRGGVRLAEGKGYLASGLGLPLLAIPEGLSAESVQIRFADQTCWLFEKFNDRASEVDRQLWEPSSKLRRIKELPIGPAVLEAAINDGSLQERTIRLAALDASLPFRRKHQLAFREDWELKLGPLSLPPSLSPSIHLDEAELRWAWQRIHEHDYNVNHLFEQQMLESLSALFQRRGSLPRRDFYALYSQLRNKPNEWPGFAEAVLRGWCEGGWLEEGLESINGRWQIQAVDPRLVQLEGGGAQLVGLLGARRLMAVLACAHQLKLTVRSVPPSCPDMPRGWRFNGDIKALSEACGLSLVEQSDWIPDPRHASWILDKPLACDAGSSWPTGLRGRRLSDRVCGRRGLDHHWKPAQPLPEQYRAPISLKVDSEITARGKRRWHSIDPVNGAEFSSCHFNRVALHALVVATDGLWPFGFTDQDRGQLDRLYDAQAYLPLPLARYLALTGSYMPGPTRHQPSDHTYRYFVPIAFRWLLSQEKLLPITSLPDEKKA